MGWKPRAQPGTSLVAWRWPLYGLLFVLLTSCCAGSATIFSTIGKQWDKFLIYIWSRILMDNICMSISTQAFPCQKPVEVSNVGKPMLPFRILSNFQPLNLFNHNIGVVRLRGSCLICPLVCVSLTFSETDLGLLLFWLCVLQIRWGRYLLNIWLWYFAGPIFRGRWWLYKFVGVVISICFVRIWFCKNFMSADAFADCNRINMPGLFSQICLLVSRPCCNFPVLFALSVIISSVTWWVIHIIEEVHHLYQGNQYLYPLCQ